MGITKKINAIIFICVLCFYNQIFTFFPLSPTGLPNTDIECDFSSIEGESVVLNLGLEMSDGSQIYPFIINAMLSDVLSGGVWIKIIASFIESTKYPVSYYRYSSSGIPLGSWVFPPTFNVNNGVMVSSAKLLVGKNTYQLPKNNGKVVGLYECSFFVHTRCSTPWKLQTLSSSKLNIVPTDLLNELRNNYKQLVYSSYFGIPLLNQYLNVNTSDLKLLQISGASILSFDFSTIPQLMIQQGKISPLVEGVYILLTESNNQLMKCFLFDSSGKALNDYQGSNSGNLVGNIYGGDKDIIYTNCFSGIVITGNSLALSSGNVAASLPVLQLPVLLFLQNAPGGTVIFKNLSAFTITDSVNPQKIANTTAISGSSEKNLISEDKLKSFIKK